MPHNSRPPMKRIDAANRLARLRAAGVPAVVTAWEAWHLSGGIVGRPDITNTATVSVASIALRVPDCEAFLPDYQALAAS